MTNPSDVEALMAEIELMEKEILIYKGKKRSTYFIIIFSILLLSLMIIIYQTSF